MASDFVYDGTDLVICNGIAGTLKDFADLYDYDVGNALTVLDAKTIATDPEAFSLDIALQPADSLAVKLTISASADRTGARVNITGTDLDGNAISETEIDISGANSTPVVTELNFATVDAAGIVVSGMTADDTITITQPRKGICWEIEEDKQYYIENVADFAVGNDSTETHFGGAENVLFAGGVMPRVRSNAFLTIEGKWIIAPDATLSMINAGETGTITMDKGGGIKITTNQIVNFYKGTVDFKGKCSLTHNDLDNSNCYFEFRANLTSHEYDDVLFENVYYVGWSSTPDEMDKIRIDNTKYGAYGLDDITLRNVEVTNYTYDFSVAADKELNLINCSSVKAPRCDDANATIKEKYTCDIKVNDPDGVGLPGVTVKCEDKDENEVFSVDTILDFAAIAGGTFHSLALKTDGSLASWGWDGYNQVKDTPAGTDFAAVACGYGHSLALKKDGSIASWGWDDYNQVADTPAGTDFAAVAGGYYHSLALKKDGSLASWGDDSYNQVADTPAGTDFAAVACGAYHNLALKTDGSIVSWGRDHYNQVADTPAGTDFAAVACGYYHSLALKIDGSIVSWARDDYNQVAYTPAGTDFAAVAGGAYHSLALKKDGSIVSWGWDNYNQVDYTPVTGAIPQQLIEKTRFTGTDETEAPKNPHVFTFTRTNYVDETLNNVTVDAPIDWLHEVVSDVEIALEDPEITLEDS